MIDRAEDGDGDAVPTARNRPAGGERGDASSAESPTAESPTVDDVPADPARTDAVLSTAEHRAAAHRHYRDTVDHTYDVARIEAAEEPQAGARDAQSRDAGASEDGAARGAEDSEGEPQGGDAQESQDPPPQGASEEGPTRDADPGPDADSDARDAWAEALPALRAAWERHEQRFPERSRAAASSQADGGWVGDGDRRLTPEQNTDASKACEDIRTEGKEVILPAMERVEAADPDRRLAGLEHMLKGEDRLKEKIADEMAAKAVLTVSKAMDTVVDSVRFTFTYPPQRYSEGIPSDVERLKSEGFELVKLKNLWTDNQYKGVNSQWRRPETGLRFEVQFHTPESLEAKELTHKAYERIRSPASPEERREMKAYQRQVNALLVTPPGTADIKDFPEKR